MFHHQMLANLAQFRFSLSCVHSSYTYSYNQAYTCMFNELLHVVLHCLASRVLGPRVGGSHFKNMRSLRVWAAFHQTLTFKLHPQLGFVSP